MGFVTKSTKVRSRRKVRRERGTRLLNSSDSAIFSNDSFQNPSIETTDLISTGETEISIVTETEEVAEGTVRAGTMMTEAAEIEALTR